jgi:hypothetical protein
MLRDKIGNKEKRDEKNNNRHHHAPCESSQKIPDGLFQTGKRRNQKIRDRSVIFRNDDGAGRILKGIHCRLQQRQTRNDKCQIWDSGKLHDARRKCGAKNSKIEHSDNDRRHNRLQPHLQKPVAFFFRQCPKAYWIHGNGMKERS